MPRARFTIIIPVFNGGQLVKQCVASALSQSFPDFEVAVLENGSTDGTAQWLQTLDDPRLTVSPSPANLGIAGNWSRILETPRGEFMTIVGHDDLLDPDYLQVMDGLIHGYPDATLYHAHFRFIGPEEESLRASRPAPDRESAAEYIAALFAGDRDTYGTGYLMRSADYDAVGGIPPFEKLLFADDALWITLMRRGYKACSSASCFACRSHGASLSASTDWQSWAKAMQQYGCFLSETAEEDAAVKRAIADNGLGYFRHYCLNKYTEALVQATKQDRRLDPAALRQMTSRLDGLIPALYDSVSSAKSIRFRRSINDSRWSRRIYNAYIHARHGGA